MDIIENSTKEIPYLANVLFISVLQYSDKSTKCALISNMEILSSTIFLTMVELRFAISFPLK